MEGPSDISSQDAEIPRAEQYSHVDKNELETTSLDPNAHTDVQTTLGHAGDASKSIGSDAGAPSVDFFTRKYDPLAFSTFGKTPSTDELPAYSAIVSQSYVMPQTYANFRKSYPDVQIPSQIDSSLEAFFDFYHSISQGKGRSAGRAISSSKKWLAPADYNQIASRPALVKSSNVFEHPNWDDVKQLYSSTSILHSTVDGPANSIELNTPASPTASQTSPMSQAQPDVASELAGLCSRYRCDHTRVVLRLTTTMHALVFDILAIDNDPLHVYDLYASVIGHLPDAVTKDDNGQSQLVRPPLPRLQMSTLGTPLNDDPSHTPGEASPHLISLVLPSSEDVIRARSTPTHLHPMAFSSAAFHHDARHPRLELPANGFHYFYLKTSLSDYTPSLKFLYGSPVLKVVVPISSVVAAPMFKAVHQTHHPQLMKAVQHLSHNAVPQGVTPALLRAESMVRTHTQSINQAASTLLQAIHDQLETPPEARITDDERNTQRLHKRRRPAPELTTLIMALPDTTPPLPTVSAHQPEGTSPELEISMSRSDGAHDDADGIEHQALTSQTTSLSHDAQPDPRSTLDYPLLIDELPSSTLTICPLYTLYTYNSHPTTYLWAQQTQDMAILLQAYRQWGQNQPPEPNSSHLFSSNHPNKLRMEKVSPLLMLSDTNPFDETPLVGHFTKADVYLLFKHIYHDGDALFYHLHTRTTQCTAVKQSPSPLVRALTLPLPMILYILQLQAQQQVLDAHTTFKLQLNVLVQTGYHQSDLATVSRQKTPSMGMELTTLPTPQGQTELFMDYVSALPIPRSLLLLVNPHGGKGNAVAIFNELLQLYAYSAHHCYAFITSYEGEVKFHAKYSSCVYGWKGDSNLPSVLQYMHKSDSSMQSISHIASALSKQLAILSNPEGISSISRSPSKPNNNSAASVFTLTTSSNISGSAALSDALPFSFAADAHAYDTAFLFSGDGLVNELINGVFRSPYWKHTFRHMALCHIPCGSGNAIAASVASISRCRSDPLSHTLLGLSGITRYIDVLSLTQDPERLNGLTTTGPSQHKHANANHGSTYILPKHNRHGHMKHGRFFDEYEQNQFMYYDSTTEEMLDKQNDLIANHLLGDLPTSPPTQAATQMGILSLSWALISDIDFESEKWRCCGGARFEFAALIRILFRRYYKARMEVLFDSELESRYHTYTGLNHRQGPYRLEHQGNRSTVEVDGDDNKQKDSCMQSTSAQQHEEQMLPPSTASPQSSSLQLPLLTPDCQTHPLSEIEYIFLESKQRMPQLPGQSLTPEDRKPALSQSVPLYSACQSLTACPVCLRSRQKNNPSPHITALTTQNSITSSMAQFERWTQQKLVFTSAITPLTQELGVIHGSRYIDPNDLRLDLPGDALSSVQSSIGVPTSHSSRLKSEPSSPLSDTATSLGNRSPSADSSEDDIHFASEKWVPVTTLPSDQRDDYDELYTIMWGFNLPYGTETTIGSPFSHLNDGFFDLYFCTDISRMETIGVMTSIDKGHHINQPGIHYIKTKGIRLDPCVECDEQGNNDIHHSNSCLMSLDGERMLLKPLELRMWDGIVQIISR